MPRDQEGQALGDDVVVRQSLAALGVDAGEHPAEQVAVVSCAALLAAFGDELADKVLHKHLVVV